MWLKYTILFSDFQPCVNKYASIYLDIIPQGSFIQNIKVGANINFTGASITGALITASFESSVYSASHSLDVFLHPYIVPVPPIPQSRDILLPVTSRKLIKIDLKTIGNVISSLSAGACDIYVQLNNIIYPYTLDLIFKQPVFCISLKHILSAFSGNVINIRRVTDNANKDFGFVNLIVDNPSIIAWLGVSSGEVRGIYSQTGGTDLLGTVNLNWNPAYNPITSLLTFDGVNDLLRTNPVFSLSDFFLSVRSQPDVNQIIGNSAIVASALTRQLNSVYYRDSGDLFTYNINSVGLKRTFIMSNNNIVSVYVDNIEAVNSPQTLAVGNWDVDQVGAKKTQSFYSGDFDELIIYDTPLSASEMLLINSI